MLLDSDQFDYQSDLKNFPEKLFNETVPKTVDISQRLQSKLWVLKYTFLFLFLLTGASRCLFLLPRSGGSEKKNWAEDDLILPCSF